MGVDYWGNCFSSADLLEDVWMMVRAVVFVMQTDLEVRFTRLAQRFVGETCMMSMSQFHHPAMQEIVNMGLPVLPFVLREIKDGASGTDWLIAVRKITGKDGPFIPKNEYGRVAILKRKYLEWAIAEGYEIAEGASPVRPFWQAANNG